LFKGLRALRKNIPGCSFLCFVRLLSAFILGEVKTKWAAASAKAFSFLLSSFSRALIRFESSNLTAFSSFISMLSPALLFAFRQMLDHFFT